MKYLQMIKANNFIQKTVDTLDLVVVIIVRSYNKFREKNRCSIPYFLEIFILICFIDRPNYWRKEQKT
jgi:hypothetical protein